MLKLIRITTVPISLEKLLENQLTFMSQFYEVVAVSSDESNLKKVGEKQGVRTFTIDMTRTISPFKDLVSLIKMVKFLRRERPLIVHTHTPKAGTVGMLAAKVAGVPHRLHTVAGLPLLETTGNRRRLLSFVEKLTYKCATGVYPNSLGLADLILQNKLCGRRKIKVLANGSSNGIDTTYFNPKIYSFNEKDKFKQELGLNDTDFIYIFVGRIVRDKGVNELVKAFLSINVKYPQSKLLLVGAYESELDPLLPDTVKRIKENSSIIEVGYQFDVRPYFAISDVLVFPSYREGFPNVVMQAGAMGLPSIVSNINGCNEIVIENENGIIIPVKNTEKLHDAMYSVISSDYLINKMKQNARKMIVSRYEQIVVWNSLLEEYKKIENV